MTAVTEELKSQLSRLPAEDRAELALYLIETVDEADAEASWDAELARRAAEIRSDAAAGEPAASVFARLREQCR